MSRCTTTVPYPEDQAHLWLPPSRMARYQWNKVIGAAVMMIIFAGWMMIQWSNPVMRAASVGLVVVTGWVLWRSVATDRRRVRGRQLAVSDDALYITAPGSEARVALADIAAAWWRDPFCEPADRAGLWLYDASVRPLAHLDCTFLADQAEARAFLGWARRRADVHFRVDWTAGRTAAESSLTTQE